MNHISKRLKYEKEKDLDIKHFLTNNIFPKNAAFLGLFGDLSIHFVSATTVLDYLKLACLHKLVEGVDCWLF